MSAVLEDPRAAADAITHGSEQGPHEEKSVQEQHAPGPQTAEAPRQVLRQEEIERPLTKEEILRPAFGALSTTIGCAFLVGGMFTGTTPRIYAAIGGIAGVALAVVAARAQKRQTLIQILTLVGILFVGLLLIGISDFGALGSINKLVHEAAKNARLRRPPAPFDEGWKAILPWTVGMVGYAAAWIGSVGRKPAVGVLVPIPIIAFAAIAQPAEAQVPAGIVAFVTFVIGLTVIYRADRGEGSGVTTAYELKRAARAAPLVLILTAGLIGLAQTNLLFPAPLYDPTTRAQLPKPIPLSGVHDRILFTTEAASKFTGPWRMGVLDVYDGDSWRLPPFSSAHQHKAPASGILTGPDEFDQPVQALLQAKVDIGGLDGTKFPLPARMYGVRGEHLPDLVVEKRTESLGVKQGQVSKGVQYEVQFGLLPTEEELRQDSAPINDDIKKDYLDVANRQMPPAMKALLDAADAEAVKDPSKKNLWDRLDYIRGVLLANITAHGVGLPAPVPPSKIQDMLDGSKEATPYEIVAAQAVMARWAGIPSRVGYGFDGGHKIGDGTKVEFHPVDGAAWLEVYFQGFGWFPVTGLPAHAEATIGGSDQKRDANILPSDQIQVQLFIPLRVPPKNVLFKQLQLGLLLLSPFIVLYLLVWLLWPVAYKSRRRSRRRQWALENGRSARIAVAYTELRDMATDLGVGDPYLTPLAYVSKVVPDDEHRELAWLVTRTLWGDLRTNVTDDEVFAAEELSRSLRRRLFEAQPFTIRGIALVSRLSLRNPYAPELLSPPVERIDALRRIRGVVGKLRLPKVPRRAKKELPHGAVEIEAVDNA